MTIEGTVHLLILKDTPNLLNIDLGGFFSLEIIEKKPESLSDIRG